MYIGDLFLTGFLIENRAKIGNLERSTMLFQKIFAKIHIYTSFPDNYTRTDSYLIYLTLLSICKL